MKLSISEEIFHIFPDFCRGVVLAWGINNQGESATLEAELRAAEVTTRTDPARRDFKRLPRVATWLQAFEKMGVNPNEMPPSIAGLMKRAVNGARLPFVSPLVAVFNAQSLKSLVPCGGDDLAAVTGNLSLRLATGAERYTPLGKPDQLERPSPGEIIYCDSGGQVLCRAWCWRNSHVTRIQMATNRVLINVDGLPPVGGGEIRQIAEELGERVREYCGGNVKTFLLSRGCPELEVEHG
jgi:DNA/RNA-binding domain of Phe-tRNA-synthetase-like protein